MKGSITGKLKILSLSLLQCTLMGCGPGEPKIGELPEDSEMAPGSAGGDDVASAEKVSFSVKIGQAKWFAWLESPESKWQVIAPEQTEALTVKTNVDSYNVAFAYVCTEEQQSDTAGNNVPTLHIHYLNKNELPPPFKTSAKEPSAVLCETKSTSHPTGLSKKTINFLNLDNDETANLLLQDRANNYIAVESGAPAQVEVFDGNYSGMVFGTVPSASLTEGFTLSRVKKLGEIPLRDSDQITVDMADAQPVDTTTLDVNGLNFGENHELSVSLAKPSQPEIKPTAKIYSNNTEVTQQSGLKLTVPDLKQINEDFQFVIHSKATNSNYPLNIREATHLNTSIPTGSTLHLPTTNAEPHVTSSSPGHIGLARFSWVAENDPNLGQETGYEFSVSGLKEGSPEVSVIQHVVVSPSWGKPDASFEIDVPDFSKLEGWNQQWNIYKTDTVSWGFSRHYDSVSNQAQGEARYARRSFGQPRLPFIAL